MVPRVQPSHPVPTPPAAWPEGLRTGIDIVHIGRIEHSLRRFGARFLRRLFTDDEVAYAESAPALRAERLAARFAAKEAALKALGLCHEGVSWRDMEVARHADGSCHLRLHGRAAAKVAEQGPSRIALSLSHEADYATAVVVWQAR